MHNCDHQIHHSEKKHHHNNEESTSDFDVDQDHCFICEFDLDVYECPEINIPSFAVFCNYTFQECTKEYSTPNELQAFSHRGPPTV